MSWFSGKIENKINGTGFKNKKLFTMPIKRARFTCRNNAFYDLKHGFWRLKIIHILVKNICFKPEKDEKIAHFDTHTVKGPNNQEVMLARVFWQYLQTKDFIFEITQFRSVIKIQYVSKTHITAAIWLWFEHKLYHSCNAVSGLAK